MPKARFFLERGLAQRLPMMSLALRWLGVCLLICAGVVTLAVQAGDWFVSPQITYVGRSQQFASRGYNLYNFDVRARQSVMLVHTDRRAPPTVFAWSPDGRRLAYGNLTPEDTDTSHSYGYYVYDTRDRSTILLPLPPGGYVGGGVPSWSPDGSRVLMIDGVRHDLCVATVDTGELNCWGMSNARQAIWSPVDDLVALVTRDGRWYTLSLLDMATGNRRELTRLLAIGVPRWSPDGEWIAVSGNRYTSTYTNLHILRIDDATRSRLILRQVGDIHNISWLPDSRSFLFDHNWSTGVFQVDVEEGFPPFRQFNHGVQRLATLPMWSPDGQWMAYGVHQRYTSGLSVARADGSPAIASRAVSLFHFAWRP